MMRRFQKLACSPVCRRKGDKVKLGRWFAWWDAAGERLICWHQLLLFLTYYGIAFNYGASLASSPLCLESTQPVPTAATSSTSSGGASSSGQPPCREPPAMERRSVKDSSREVDDLRKQSRNTMDLCVRILASRLSRRLAWVLYLIPLALREDTGKWIVMAKNARGTKELFMSWSAGAYATTLQFTFGVLRDTSSLALLGFAGPRNPTYMDIDSKHDQAVLDATFCFLANLVGMQLMGFMYYSHCLPGMFALLISHCAATREACLARLRKIWGWL